MSVSVRLGFVPSYRFQWTPWTTKMREDSFKALSALPGVAQVVMPQPSPDEKTLDAEKGLTPFGAVHDLDEAETIAEYFRRQKVDALVLCPLDFGDERSAAKIAEKLGVPVLLYATKEPPALDGPAMARRVRLVLRQPLDGLGALSPQDPVPLCRHLLPRTSRSSPRRWIRSSGRSRWSRG